MDNELDYIKEKVINIIAIISAFFIGFPYILSVVRFMKVGWDYTFIWHTMIYATVIMVAVFRTRILIKNKVIVIACIYTLISIISLYKFAFFGAYYFIFIGVAILVILHGIKSASYLVGVFSVVYVIIGLRYIAGNLHVPMPQNYASNIFSWIAILITLLSISLVIIKGFGQFYTELIIIIKNKEKTERELEKHKNQLETIVDERTIELKQTIQTLKETQSQLLQAEKMASLGILTSGVSHEINNPLNYILGGYTGLEKYFEEKGIQDETVEILMHSIKTGIDRSSKIVSGLNQFSRNNETLEEQCDIHEIMDNCLLMIRHQVKNRIEITKDYSKDCPLIIGNVGKMHQVFLNVLINACQSIEDKGRIVISTKTTEDIVLIKVSDTGVGISKENLSRVLDPFYTTKDPGMGTGMGLAITYSILKEHEGQIDIESDKDIGTTVKISLPIK